jgi:hypothetical protein
MMSIDTNLENIMPVTSVQFGQSPWYYLTGLGISNNTTTPNTKLDVAIGSTFDSTAVYQMTLSTPLTINAATNGLNGLDTGTLAASTVYAVYLVGDPVDLNPTGAILSLGYNTTFPLLPSGYSVFSLIGFCTTDSSAHILKGYWESGASSTARKFFYDAPQATSVTAGNATSFTAVDLHTLVPTLASGNLFGFTPFPKSIYINSSYVPATAGNSFEMTPAGGTGNAITVTGQVATVPVTTQSLISVTNLSNVPTIEYKVSNGSDAVAINVAGYVAYLT